MGARRPNISKQVQRIGQFIPRFNRLAAGDPAKHCHLQADSRVSKEEIYGLTIQLRRAGVSVASNIAEGYGRASSREYRQFLAMARGSNLEIQTQLTIAGQLGFGDRPRIRATEELSHEVGRMLGAIITKLAARRNA